MLWICQEQKKKDEQKNGETLQEHSSKTLEEPYSEFKEHQTICSSTADWTEGPKPLLLLLPMSKQGNFSERSTPIKKKKKNFFVSTVDQPLGIQHGFKEEKLKHILLECNEYNCPLRERLKQELQTYNNLPPLMETILTNTSLLTLALKSHRIHHDIGLTLSWTHDRTPFRNKTLWCETWSSWLIFCEKISWNLS